MRFRITDQFGVPLPNLTKAVNEDTDLPKTIRKTKVIVNGDASFCVLDNPLAGLTCEEAGERLGLDARTVRGMCLEGTLRATRYPSCWRIGKREVERYMKAKRGDA